MAEVITESITLTSTSCCRCGIAFAVPLYWLEARRRDCKTIYCPNGHGLSYEKTEAERLKEELERKKKELESERHKRQIAESDAECAREAAQRQVSAAKGQVTKIKKRIANATCPCCNRYFPNDKLAVHLKTKHPDFQSADLG